MLDALMSICLKEESVASSCVGRSGGAVEGSCVGEVTKQTRLKLTAITAKMRT